MKTAREAPVAADAAAADADADDSNETECDDEHQTMCGVHPTGSAE
jgi:hypothetical protein